MKQTPLKRTSALKQTSSLKRGSGLARHGGPGRSSGALSRSKGLAPMSAKGKAQKAARLPGEEEWKAPHRGHCSLCNAIGPLERHHVVEKKHVRDRSLKYDIRNAMELGVHCPCHEWHTNAAKRIRVDQLPADAVAFAVQIFGAEYAEDYLARYYAPKRQGGVDVSV